MAPAILPLSRVETVSGLDEDRVLSPSSVRQIALDGDEGCEETAKGMPGLRTAIVWA